MSHEIEGACLYCGQVQILKGNEPLTGEAANAYVTKYCKCEKAQMQRMRDALTENLERILGPESAQYGYEAQDEETVDLIRGLMTAIEDDKLRKADIVLACGDKVTIKYNKRFEMTVVRVKAKQKLEI